MIRRISPEQQKNRRRCLRKSSPDLIVKKTLKTSSVTWKTGQKLFEVKSQKFAHLPDL